jgi:hypothetical protein
VPYRAGFGSINNHFFSDMNISIGVSLWLWTSPFNANTTELFPKIRSFGFDSVKIPVEEPDLIDTKKGESSTKVK